MITAEGRSPGYYARRRFLRNGPAVASAVVILLAALVAVLGYLILPDSTPGANQSLPVLQKKQPGFSVQLLRIHTGTPAQKSFFTTLLYGRREAYREMAVSSFRLVPGGVALRPYARAASLPEPEITLSLQELQPVSDKSFSPGPEPGTAEAKAAFAARYLEKRTFWLGTDKAGRDVLSRLLLGTRISLSVGLLAVLLSLTVGTVAGAVAGFLGGWVDKVLLWFMTVVWSIPGIILVIAISLALQQKGLVVMFIAVGLTTWVEVARLVRGEVLVLKQRTFIEAAAALGIPAGRVLWRHVLPNLLGPLIVVASANFASAILMEAGLSFLGLGVQPPTPSWGVMVSEGFQLLGTAASLHLIIWPSLCICIMVMAFNLVGNGLRDANDPKLILS